MIILDGDAISLFAFELDGFCNIVDWGAVNIVVDQTSEKAIDDAAASDLVGVSGYERVLRLGWIQRNKQTGWN